MFIWASFNPETGLVVYKMAIFRWEKVKIIRSNNLSGSKSPKGSVSVRESSKNVKSIALRF